MASKSKRRIRKDGLFIRGRIWWCRVAGERRSTECKDVEAARIVRARLEREAADPAAAASRRTKVGDMIAHVLADRKTAKGKTGGVLSPETLGVWEMKLGHFGRVVGLEVPLAEIDYDLVGRFLDQREREGAGQHTRSKELGAVRFGLRLEKQRGAYPHDVDHVTRTRRFAVGYKPRKRHLTWEEIPKLLGALLQEDPNRVPAETIAYARHWRARGFTLEQIAKELGKAISTVKRYLTLPDPEPVRGGLVHAQHAAWLIATAARDGEGHRAEMRDHDLIRWRVDIRGTKTGKAEATIPIALVFRDLLLFALHDRPEKGPLFPRWANIGRALKLACKRAGIPPVSPNDLRRTHASLLSQAGVSNSELKHIVRHTTTRMLDAVYAVTNLDAVGSAIDKVPAQSNLLPPSTTPSRSSKKAPK